MYILEFREGMCVYTHAHMHVHTCRVDFWLLLIKDIEVFDLEAKQLSVKCK